MDRKYPHIMNTPVVYRQPGNPGNGLYYGITDTDAHEGDARNALRYLVDALPKEPLFVIRGRDLFAIPVIGAYLKGMEFHSLDEMAIQVERHLHRFEEWQRANRNLVKIPDAYPGWEKCGPEDFDESDQADAQEDEDRRDDKP